MRACLLVGTSTGSWTKRELPLASSLSSLRRAELSAAPLRRASERASTKGIEYPAVFSLSATFPSSHMVPVQGRRTWKRSGSRLVRRIRRGSSREAAARFAQSDDRPGAKRYRVSALLCYYFRRKILSSIRAGRFPGRKRQFERRRSRDRSRLFIFRHRI